MHSLRTHLDRTTCFEHSISQYSSTRDYVILNVGALAILQYNVRKKRVDTMIPLFEDNRILNYDVIVI